MERVSLGAELQVKVHHCDDIIEAGAGDSWPYHIHIQEQREWMHARLVLS